ncbi:MAG: MBL fold metallo-hydrolase [Betaproteobacteria bacterium]|nr:MBL fold metallo-hydrolase [Betaproteobacteria bacterium]
MRFRILPVTPFEQNCSLIWCDSTRRAALVDPGGDVDTLLEAVEQAGVRLDKLLLTHAHLDHVGGARQLALDLGLPIHGPEEGDAFWLDALPEQARMFGFPPSEAFRPDHWLHDGDSVELGDLRLRVIHCPGHTPGHVVFFEPESRHAFVGDVLFQGSIGRTDFPRGDHQALLHAIRHKLFPLGDDVAFVPGHGPMSTFGQERLHNPFVGERA